MVYCTVAYRGGLHRKNTKDLWNTQIADIREDIGYCLCRRQLSVISSS